MRDHFHRLADRAIASLRGGEACLIDFSGEESDFVRFNRSSVRQAGSVVQRSLSIDLIEGRRHAAGTITLSGDGAEDESRLDRMVGRLRDARGQAVEDPHLLYATEVRSSERRDPNRLPERSFALVQVEKAGRGRDLVGIYAAGAIHAGFANSLGQRNWFTTHSFNLDWSFHREEDRAVKTNYAGVEWQPAEFERRAILAAEHLERLGRPARAIAPGGYRAYLAPAALYEIVSLLGWGGFGLRAHRTKTTPLLRMVEEGARLHPSVTIAENTGEGIAPDFQEAGFVRPPRVALVREGRFETCLASPRSAVEYGAETNGASAAEAPESVDVAPGDVPMSEVLSRLATGVYVGNLWYLNFSDRSAGRLTGLTRFASFWVERGEIRAPLGVMRFDETIYRMLGENLIGLTRERELVIDPGSYSGRSTDSGCLPGALVEDFTFTL